MKKPFTLLLAGAALMPGPLPIMPAAALMVAGAVALAPANLQALPRGPVYRAPVRGTARRTARRTTRRVTRRHYWALPGPYTPFRWGAYNYYRCGGIFYYPYMFGGRTVYVEVNVDSSGNPLPPPPPDQVAIDIDIN